MRTIPVSLLEHKRFDATTLCLLIRIETEDGEVIGLTTLDKNVSYDDGQGLVDYNAPVGFEPASIYAAADFTVDNTEFKSLVPAFDLPLNEYRVNAGKYDYAKFDMYEVNYEGLGQGHWVVMHGTLGQMRTMDGISLFGELRSLMDQFKKPMCELDSLTCRAKFGSQPGQERFPCGFDASVLWVDGVITSVGFESNRTFSDDSRTEPVNYFVPGLVQFTSGLNIGRYVEIESYTGDTSGGTVSLNFTTPYAMAVGDTYRIRRDCTKIGRDEVGGCKFWFGAEWVNHFRGEPDIPVGDAGQLSTPGSSVSAGSGGKTSEDEDD